MRRLLLVCLVMLSASPAWAQESNDALLTDYIGLCKLLRANGVEPVAVNWMPIEASCLGLKTETDQVPYNRCRFDKAMDAADYGPDRNACSAKARATYPDSLLTNQALLTIAKKGGTSTVFQQPMSYADLDANRTSTFNECMAAKGWRDAQNASRGRQR